MFSKTRGEQPNKCKHGDGWYTSVATTRQYETFLVEVCLLAASMRLCIHIEETNRVNTCRFRLYRYCIYASVSATAVAMAPTQMRVKQVPCILGPVRHVSNSVVGDWTKNMLTSVNACLCDVWLPDINQAHLSVLAQLHVLQRLCVCLADSEHTTANSGSQQQTGNNMHRLLAHIATCTETQDNIRIKLWHM